MTKYRITLGSRFSKRVFEVQAENVADALFQCCDITQDEDDTGYFFETADADPALVDELRRKGLVFTDAFGVEVAPVEVMSVEEI